MTSGTTDTGPPATGTDLVWRPVQYLGNKQRVLPAILAAVGDLTGGRPAVLADAFSGSGVVTQALALRGHRVRAVDASPASAVLARAATGAGADGGYEDLSSTLEALLAAAGRGYVERTRPWARHLAAEEAALRDGDGARLAAVQGAFPQVWREAGAAAGPGSPLARWHRSVEAGTPYAPGLLSAVFAGTYLSLRQSLVLEGLLASAHAAAAAGEIDAWTLDAVRALAMHAASAAAFSAGKHFAQPHRLTGGKDLTFHHARLLTDRAVDVEATARAGACRLAAVAGAIGGTADVLCTPVEDARRAWTGAAVVYADPPYTAQQYSRFYHVLDLLASGIPRPLQAARNTGATAGLYPTGRFLSDFCRVRRAPDVLRAFVRDVRDAGAHLVLSYSASATGDTGNARVIPLSAVTEILEAVYGSANVDRRWVPLTYRSFNRTSVPNAADREVLVVARAA